MKLVHGYYNYSSWSLRPWIALKVANIPFESQFMTYAHSQDLEQFAAQYDLPAKVPVLLDGDLVIWETLAILEYLAESYPDAQLLPADKGLRALVRSAASEMHSGFMGLRNDCSMNCRATGRRVQLSEESQADLKRLAVLWDKFAQFPNKPAGEFLAGHFTLVDAMFAPVMWRTVTYGLEVSPEFARWSKAMQALPAMQEWLKASQAEADQWVIDKYEVGI